MNSPTLRKQCSDNQLADMIAGGRRMAESGEREIHRLEEWHQCELSAFLNSDPSEELDALRRSVDVSRELVEAAKAALAL